MNSQNENIDSNSSKSDVTVLRLSKVAKEFNISLGKIIAILNAKGIYI
jgi:hypothetical protein